MKRLLSIVAAIAILCGCCNDNATAKPYWLDANIEDPQIASKVWFKGAKYGLFIHFTLASLLEYGKDDYIAWVNGSADERALKFVGVTSEEYQAAKSPKARINLIYNKFIIPNFDAEEICKLAKAANMNYINFTTMHMGGCYNFNTAITEFNSLNSPAQRDLVAEMIAACNKYEIPLFLYVPPQISASGNDQIYTRNREYLTELLTQYGDVAGIWFDGIGGWHDNPANYKYLTELHQLVRRLQPHALVSFKTGAFGDEDFISSEHYLPQFDYDFTDKSMNSQVKKKFRVWNKTIATANEAYHSWNNIFQYKLREICAVSQECRGRTGCSFEGGWVNDERAKRASAEDIYELLSYARSAGSNLILNIGLRADGSIHPEDEKGILGAAEIINTKGWPELDNEVLIPGLQL